MFFIITPYIVKIPLSINNRLLISRCVTFFSKIGTTKIRKMFVGIQLTPFFGELLFLRRHFGEFHMIITMFTDYPPLKSTICHIP